MLEVGVSAEVVAVRESRTDVLEHLSKNGLVPGQQLTLLETSPLEGPLVLQIGVQRIPLGVQMAELILVRRIE
jgi:Fe2+ transport system protein FeoA